MDFMAVAALLRVEECPTSSREVHRKFVTTIIGAVAVNLIDL